MQDTVAALPVKPDLSVETDAITRDPAGLTCGRARVVTLITPIRPAFSMGVRLLMKYWPAFPFIARHSLQFNFIYYVRWSVFSDLGYNGAPQKREKLKYWYMYFESNFDTPWKQYIDAFAYVIPTSIAGLWGRGPDFPNPPPSEPLKRWIERNSMNGGHYYSAYPHASVKMVRSALRIQPRFDALAAAARTQSPGEFQASWRRFLADVQNDI